MEDEIPKVRSTGLALRILLVALPGLLLVAAVAAWAAGLLPAELVGGPRGTEAVRPAERAHTLLVREQRESTGRLELAARLLAREPALAALPAAPAGTEPATDSATDSATDPATDPATRDAGAPAAGDPAQAAAPPAGEDRAAEAGPAVSAAALTDLLEQRRDELGYDFALVLSPDGRVLAATGDLAELAGRQLAAAAGLLQAARDGGSASGAWRHGERLAWLAAARVAPEFELRGHVAAGTWIAERTALELAGLAGAAVLLAVPAEGGGWRPVAASAGGEAMEALLAGLPEPSGLAPGEPREVPVDLAGGARRALVVPLEQPDGALAGAAVLAPRAAAEDATAPLVLAAAVGIALLLTLLLAAVLARRTVAPVARLSGHVRAAPREGFSRRLEARRHGLLAPLAAALDRLFAGLREERSLTAVAAAAATGPAARTPAAAPAEAGGGAGRGTGAPGAGPDAAGAAEEPETRRAVVLAVDLRAHARPSPLGAGDTAQRLARDVARVGAEVAARGGRVRGAAGHRLLAEFGTADPGTAERSATFSGSGSGPGPAFGSGPAAGAAAGGSAPGGPPDAAEARAVTAGAAVLAALAELRGAGDEEAEPPALAVASGSVTSGGAAPGPGGGCFLVGPAVQIADSLLREAAPGDLVMTRAVFRAAEPVLQAAGVAASAQRGLLSPQPLYLVSATDARRLAGDAAAPLPEEPPASAPAAPAAGPAPEVVAGRYQVLAAPAAPGGTQPVLDRDTGEEAALRRLLRLEGGELGFDGPLPELRRVTHPNLARTLDFGDGAGGGYLVREWVRGTPLPALGELPPPAALAAARQLVAALAALHGEGLAHLRVKPENVLVEPSGRVRLTDAGVGLVEGPAPSASAGERLLAPEQRKTEQRNTEQRNTEQRKTGQRETGQGKAEQRPPGQSGGRGDARSDVWAAGALLGRMAAGSWWGERDPQAELPAGLAAVVDRCLEQDPERRYPDAAALAAALDGVTA